eukprot:3938920-Amphidinium_carterae.1
MKHPGILRVPKVGGNHTRRHLNGRFWTSRTHCYGFWHHGGQLLALLDRILVKRQRDIGALWAWMTWTRSQKLFLASMTQGRNFVVLLHGSTYIDGCSGMGDKM